jgi:hypothetical protein
MLEEYCAQDWHENKDEHETEDKESSARPQRLCRFFWEEVFKG